MSLSLLLANFGSLSALALALWSTAVAIGAIQRRSTSAVLPALLVGGSVLLLLAACVGSGGSWHVPLYLADARFDFVSDPLARWFVGIIALIGIPVAVFAPGYLAHHTLKLSTGHVWAGLALLFASMVGVVLAANAIAFSSPGRSWRSRRSRSSRATTSNDPSAARR